MLLDPLAVIGIFMLGASAGSVVTYAKYRDTIGQFRRALESSVVKDMRPPEDIPVVRQADGTVAAGRQEARKRGHRSCDVSICEKGRHEDQEQREEDAGVTAGV